MEWHKDVESRMAKLENEALYKTHNNDLERHQKELEVLKAQNLSLQSRLKSLETQRSYPLPSSSQQKP
jgi:dipeptidase